MFCNLAACTVSHKSHDPCFYKKYIEAGVMNFVAHCTGSYTLRYLRPMNQTQSYLNTCIGYSLQLTVAWP